MKKIMRGKAVFALLLALALCAGGCSTRSISDSGYRESSSYRGGKTTNPLYKGELTEFDVLGIEPETPATPAELAKTLAAKRPFRLPGKSSLMLVQSGALIPDNEMIRALSKLYSVSVFSGLPLEGENSDYASSIRLAAAKGGQKTIMVYWGVLETAQKSTGAKAVSWVPFVGGNIPDENQEMRIRLKIMLIDVETGQWESFSPVQLTDTASSSRFKREASDQAQVGSLKSAAYNDAVEELAARYSK